MEMTDAMRADAIAREKIVNNTDVNYFVEAGAGSGKTTMLVRRMVAMVEAGTDVSKISAITFTKAAAGEFYERFQKLLAERSTARFTGQEKLRPGDLGEPTEETRARCVTALQNIDLCFMGTIDSFCNMILGEHPSRANVPADATIKTDDEMLALYLREYTLMLKGEGEYKELREEAERFDKLMGANAREAFMYAIAQLADVRHAEMDLPEPPEPTLDEWMAEDREVLCSLVEAIEADKAMMDASRNGDAKSKAAAEGFPGISTDVRSLWDENCSNIKYALKNIQSLRINEDTDIAVMSPAMTRLMTIMGVKKKYYGLREEEIGRILQRIEDYEAAVCMPFLRKASAIIADKCRKDGSLVFFDYLLYLRDMLRTDAAGDGGLIEHIYDRHRYFLIDEFQDTNPMQAEIFFYLTAQKPVADWRRCVPKPGSLFIVGDPKQSIYRFRSADVGSYARVRELFNGEVGEVLGLTRNFRSTRTMRNWFNNVFSELMPEDTANQSHFDMIPLEEQSDSGIVSGAFTYDVGGTRSMLPAEQESIVDVIMTLVDNPKYVIEDKSCPHRVSDGEVPVRTIDYKDFMIVTPTKTKLADIMCALEAKKIPYYVEGRTLFSECSAFMAISSVYDAVCAPYDAEKLYGALTGDAFGIDAMYLASLLEKGFKLKIYRNLEDNGNISNGKYVNDCLNILEELANEAKKSSSSALYRMIMERLDIFELAGKKNAEYVWFALELLRTEEKEGHIMSVADGAEYLNKLVTGDLELERCMSMSEDSNRVHLANLHKVKGLEAPVVILACIASSDREPVVRVEYEDAANKAFVFSVQKPFRQGDFSSPVYLKNNMYPNEAELERQSLSAEKLRLIYVAATRAANILVVAKKEGANLTEDPGSAGYWGVLAAQAEDDFFNCFDREDVNEPRIPHVEQAPIRHFVPMDSHATYSIQHPSTIKVKGKSAADSDTGAVTGFDVNGANDKSIGDSTLTAVNGPDSKSGRRDGALIGTMVHKVMEILVSSKNRADEEALIAETVNEYSDNKDSAVKRYTDILSSVVKTIRAGGFQQNNGSEKDILQLLLSADEVMCEVPFCYREDATIWNGVMDVVYKKGDEWYIVDYKTNAEAEGLEEHYDGQLRAYERAFESITGHTAVARIYHIEA